MERLAFVALVVTVGCLGMFLPLLGYAAYIVPAVGSLAQQGHPEMIQVMDQTFREPFILIPFFGFIVWSVGIILLGIAIWRSGHLWKWSGLLFVLSAVTSVPLDIEVLSLASSILLGLAQLTVGVALFRAVRGETSTPTVAPESSMTTD